MANLLIHAGGYLLSPWRGNEINEIRTQRGEFRNPQGKIVPCKWSPGTADFAAAGAASGGSTGAADVAAMIKVIEGKPVDSIDELRIIGHSNKEVFALGGETRCDTVHFINDAALIGNVPAFISAIPKIRAVQDRLTRDAKVILLGCNGGNGGSGDEALLSLLSHAFVRTAAGFKEEIQYNFEYAPTQLPAGTLILTGRNPTRITIRGRMKYEAFGEIGATWQTNAWDLKPDATNNEGDVFIGARDTNRARGATTLFWKILKEFFSKPWAAVDHPWVSLCGVDSAVTGMRVTYYHTAQTTQEDGVTVQKAAGAHIHLNPDFGIKTTARTLKNRIAEITKALELVQAKQSGDVPVTW